MTAVVVERLTQSFTASTSHALTLPATGVGDELFVVLLLLAADDITEVATPDGWTRRSNIDLGLSAAAVYLRKAEAGDYGSTVDFVTEDADTGRAILLRISLWSGTLSEVEAAASSFSSNAAPNPPNLDPVGGARDELWIACGLFLRNSGTTTYSEGPTNYDDLTIVGTGPTIYHLATAERALNATSEDPGPFVMTGSVTSSGWAAFTINVPPGTAGTPPTGTGALSLPFLSLTGAGLHGQRGTAALELPFLMLEAAGVMHPEGTAALSLPFLAVSGAGLLSQPATGSGSLSLPFLSVAGIGTHPVVTGSSALSLPMLSVSGVGEAPMVATGTLSLPFLVVSGTGVHVEYVSVDIPLGAAGRATLGRMLGGGAGRHASRALSPRPLNRDPLNGGLLMYMVRPPLIGAAGRAIARKLNLHGKARTSR